MHCIDSSHAFANSFQELEGHVVGACVAGLGPWQMEASCKGFRDGLAVQGGPGVHNTRIFDEKAL